MRTSSGLVDTTATVAALRRCLDDLATVDVVDLPDQAVRDELLSLLVGLNQLQAAVAARSAVFDARGLSDLDGCRDLRTFLLAFSRIPRRTSTQLRDNGRALRQLPHLSAAAGAGQVSADHVARVAKLVADLDAATVRAHDETLTALACAATPKEVEAACDRIRAHADPDGPEPERDKDFEARELTLHRRANHVVIRGRLDLTSGAALLTALDALQRPPAPDDLRTPGQRRADALAELARRALDHGCLPTVHGQRPHLGIIITPRALTAQSGKPRTVAERAAAFIRWLDTHQPNGTPTAGPKSLNPSTADATTSPVNTLGTAGTQAASTPGTAGMVGMTGAAPTAGTALGGAGSDDDDSAWLDWVGEVPADIARLIACDANIWRTILDPRTGLPLDVGRAQRSAPTWMRRALYTRDRTCRFPGCTTPAAWTDVHHLDHWIRGGHTTIERLLLLCRFHHRKIHHGWGIDFDQHTGHVTVTRPDGQPYELDPTNSWTGPTTIRAA